MTGVQTCALPISIRLANLEGPTLRQAVAYVPQGRSLLHTTIRDNLCLGRSLDEKELDSLCVRVNMDTVIQSLPKKYDTIVGVDHDFSEGQAQRLAIARAMAANARLVVMDEPFSALDPDNIARLARILQADTDRGYLIISHETQSLSIATHVYTLKGGTLYESASV